jgi:predicted aldo/keto reductase-like oxidoreductase
MQRNPLGDSGLSVSRLCYGTLTLCASQSNKTPREGGELIAYALERGVNFLDTAELYGTYPHIRHALGNVSEMPVISTKSYAYDRSGAAKSIELARREMDCEVIDIFMLHEQENVLTMMGHSDALKYYISMKEKGIIKAVGLSTHAIEPVQAIALAKGGSITGELHSRVKEFDLGLFREIDVIHPIINIEGLGLLDGTAEMMTAALKVAASAGTGIFGMKMFGGGNLLNDFDKALDYALSQEYVHSFAVGMQCREEIDMNVTIFNGEKISSEDIEYAKKKNRRLVVENWCSGCGECTRKCKAGAISVENGKAVVDTTKCILCSYCARACKDFAIKVV